MDDHPFSPRRRAEGALLGVAIGDAVGMPTQLLSRPEVVARYGPRIDGFHPGPPDHPIAAGLPAGSVTDDTEQAVLVGRLLLAGRGQVDAADLADALVKWEDGMRAKGSLDLLGPSSRAAIAALAAGASPEEAGRRGATNGAAMRIAPVGVATPPGAGDQPWSLLVDRVVAASRATHNTGIALAGAAAVAAAVSAAMEGEGIAGATAAAIEAARLASGRGYWVAGADVAARIEWATQLVAGLPIDDAMARIVTLVGTSLASQESVPAAFAVLAVVPGDPWLAVRVAASLGGDTDTMAAMAGAVTGAVHGADAWPEAVREAVLVDDLHVIDLADDLHGLRTSPRAGGSSPASSAALVSSPRSSAALGSSLGASAALGSSSRSSSPPAAPSGSSRFVLAGEAVLDVTAWLPAPPPRGGDVVATATAMMPGGGFNVMAAAARQGVDVLYTGRHGTGPAGDLVRAALSAEGITVLRPADPDTDTGFVMTTIEPDGERTFVTDPAALMQAGPADFSAIPTLAGDIVYVSGYGVGSGSGPALAAWVAGLPPAVTLIFDPGPLASVIPPSLLGLVLGRADWLSCNAREAALLTGDDDPEGAALSLRGRTRGGVLVRTGPAGCVVVAADAPLVSVPAPRVDAVDTTGAGDTHVGVFAAGLAAGLAPLEAARRANVAAALSVTRPGPATAPLAAEIDAALAL